MRTLLFSLFLLFLCPFPLLSADLPTVRFAYQDRVGSVIPMVAVQQGLFEQEGVRVESVQFSSGPANAEALYSGSVDVAAMGDTAALIMLSKRPDMVVLASHATGEHRHRLMVRTDASLTRLEDLRGKNVGIKRGTSTHGGLLLALQQHGMSEGDLHLIDLSPSTMSEALAAGSIEAFAASEPTPSVAEAHGARELTTFGGLGNTYPILILAPKAFVAASGEGLTRFFRALKKAEAYAAAHPADVTALLAEQSGLSPQAVSGAMSRHSYRLRLDRPIRDSLAQTAAFLREQGVLTGTLALDGHLDGRFLQ